MKQESRDIPMLSSQLRGGLNIIIAILLIVAVYPLQYFLGTSSNYLPIQVLAAIAILIFYGRLTINKRYYFLYMLFVIYVQCIFIYNISNPYSIISNPILVSFLVMLSILLLHKNDISRDSIHTALGVFYLIFVFYSLYINMQFIFENGLSERFKGFGSGTLYATLSVFGITYYLINYKYLKLNFIVALSAVSTLFLSIFLTQSRGALIVLLIIIVSLFVKSTKSFAIMTLAVILLLIASSQLLQGIIQLDFLQRLAYANYDSLEAFSSGRIVSQVAILDSFSQASNPIEIFFGFGLNEVKDTLVAQQGLELPHFDLLYILYDGGLVSITMFLLLLRGLMSLEKTKVIWIVYILSSFHTNMIISPGFLVLTYLMILHLDKSRISTANIKGWITDASVIHPENNGDGFNRSQRHS